MVHPFLEEAPPVAIAHRGGDHVGAENTLAAFEDAVRLGYRTLETDLQVTRDGVLVLHHDETLDRVTDRRGTIAKMPLDEVRAARVSGREPVPTFDEAVASFPDVRWIVDVKVDAAVGLLLRRVRDDDDLLARLCVGSFSDRRLARVRAELGSRVCTSAGPVEARRFLVAVTLRRQPRLTADLLQVPPRVRGLRVVDRRFVAAAHELGRPVQVWTVNRERHMHRLLDLGVDGLLTDRTRLLRDVIRGRGHPWPSGPARADGAPGG